MGNRHFVAIRLLYGLVNSKRKCGVDLVYLKEGCGDL